MAVDAEVNLNDTIVEGNLYNSSNNKNNTDCSSSCN